MRDAKHMRQERETSRSTVQHRGGNPDADVHAAAEAGVRGGGGALPFADRIQHSFGSFDVSGIRAHTGGDARQANESMGSMAYATGSDVAFRGAPDLFTAAHEAAHVIQQQAGVQLRGGVGEVGDRYEQHADAVAARVVQGKSAEDLLATMAGGSGHHAIQQRQTRTRGASTGEEHASASNQGGNNVTRAAGMSTGHGVVQARRNVQHNALRELWYGVTNLPEVIRNNRSLDRQRAIEQLNESLGTIKTTLDAMAEANEAGGARIPELSANITRIRGALGALDTAVGVMDAARIATRWSTAQEAWNAHRNNPSPESAQRAARAAGDIISPLGRLLSRFPPPIGGWAGILEHANADFFSGVVGNIHHSDRRLRSIYREAGLDENGNEPVGRDGRQAR